jgi:hypothetical protein
MRYFLKRVKIEGFRGVNNESEPLDVKFEVDKVNSLFAPNGTGKSSVFDAIYFALNGKLPKLEILHQVEHGDEYYVNRFHVGGIATIELEFETDETTPTTHSIKIVRHADGSKQITSPSGYADPQKLLDSLNQSFTMLDYHTFNKFIDHTPLDRGRSFSTLLGLDIYSDFRQTLKTAIDTRALRADLGIPTIESEISTLTTASGTALSRLDSAYGSLVGESIEDVEKLETYEAKVLGVLASIELVKPVVKDKTFDELDFDAIKAAVKSAEASKDQEKLAVVTGTLTKLNALGEPNTQVIEDDQQSLNTMIAESVILLTSTAGLARKQLYLAADHLLSSGGWHDSNTCPLCSSELDSPIADVVAQQRQQYTDFDAKVGYIKTTWENSTLRTRVATLELAIGADVPDEEKQLATFDQKVKDGVAKVENLTTLTTGAKIKCCAY